MASFTTNKNLEKPANGEYVDQWDVPLNGDMNIIDAAFGGVTSLNATSGSANLSVSQYQKFALNVTGAMSASVTYTIPNGVGGYWVVRNATTDATGGPWSVTIASGGGGSNVTALRDKNILIWSDGTNIRNVDENVATIGTVTSVAVSGGTTGLTANGSPITTNGTITLGGVLNVASGGTNLTAFGTGVSGALSANTTGSGGMVLQSNATLITPTISNATASNATLITPILGTPISGNLVNTTGLPISNTTGTLTVARGGTGLTTLTANNLLVGAGTSNVTFIAPGTSGNLLTSNGTAWVSAAPPTTGAWVKIAVTTVSVQVDQVDFTNLSSYLSLRFTFNNIRPSSDGEIFMARLSSDNGVNFINTITYNAGGTTSSEWLLAPDGVGSASGDGGLVATLTINNFNISQKTMGSGSVTYFTATASSKFAVAGITQSSQTAMNAIRFFFGSGKISAGTILVEGWTGS